MDYYFPADLPVYATLHDIPDGVQVRLTVTVITGASGASLKAVYADDYAAFAAGTYSILAGPLDVSAGGFYATDWTNAPAGERCIGMIADTEGDIQSLVVGLAEVQLKGA